MKKHFYLMALLLLLGSAARSQTEQDIIDLRNEAKEVFMEGAPTNPNRYKSVLEQQITDGTYDGNGLLGKGSFLDIEYPTPGVNKDFPVQHLKDLVRLAQGYVLWSVPNTTFTLEPDYSFEELKIGIVDGLKFWIAHKALFELEANSSWFDREIEQQRELQQISVLFYDELVLDAVLKADVSSYFPINTLDAGNGNAPYTGANKADIATSIIAKGILQNDFSATSLVEVGVTELECTMAFTTNDFDFDGIRRDLSFQQHNEHPINPNVNLGLLYAGGYGQSFIENVGRWGQILHGNYYDYSQARKDDFFNFVLNGYRWMVIGNNTDYSANGRYISRKYPGNNGAIPLTHMNYLIAMAADGAGPQDELSAMAAYGLQSFGEEKHKHFWNSDYVCHQSGSYFSSVRMCSSRTLGTESLEENKRGYWLPYGCTFIYRNGLEYIRPDPNSTETDPEKPEFYENIFPSWDWSYIPGVTSPVVTNTDHLMPGDNDVAASVNTQNDAFVGNANNTKYGVTAMNLNKVSPSGTVLAKKSWFHFGDEIIALGADISGPASLHTTINQTLRTGTLAQGTSSQNTKWFQHDGIAYILPPLPNGPQFYETETITNKPGDWDWIGKQNGVTNADVFKSWINHTGNNANAYYYIIAPGQNAATYTNPITLLHNSNTIQAVKKESAQLAGVVYYRPASGGTFQPQWVNVSNNVRLRTLQPCALLYDGNTGEVCISSPDRMDNSITLEYEIRNNQNQLLLSNSLTFTLPQDDFAGTSTCQRIVNLGGRITTHCPSNLGVSNVGIPIGNNSVFTDANGDYTIGISHLANVGTGNLVIDPVKNTDILNGVSTLDIVLISKHILQTQPLTTPYRRIAADVNRSGAITTFDNVAIRRVLLFLDLQFPANVNSWEFVRSDYVFPNSPNPFGSFPNFWPFPQTISLGVSTAANNPNNDFEAIKMGDVNCSAINTLIEPCEEELVILAEEKALRENDVFTYALRTENFDNIAAYQFALRFDATKLQYQNIQQGDLNRAAKPENFNLTTSNTGLIRTLWLHNDASNPAFTVIDTSLADYASLFLIQFKALQDIPVLSDVINLSADDLPGGAWSDGEDCTRNVVMQFMPEGFADNRSSEQMDSENLINKIHVHPNPTTGALSFEISTDIAAENTIQIYSTTGQQVLRQSVYLEKGNNTIPMEDISNWQDGLYFYTITDASGLLRSGKFVKQ